MGTAQSEGRQSEGDKTGDGGASDPRLSIYDYALPDELIARYPPARRDGARLLLLAGGGPARDLQVRDLPGCLRPGDLLVVNDTKVVKARVHGRRATGGRVEIFFLDTGDFKDPEVFMNPQEQSARREHGVARALIRPARRLKVGECLEVVPRPSGAWPPEGLPLASAPLDPSARRGPACVEILARCGDHWQVRSTPRPLDLMAEAGDMPLPPYLDRPAEALDEERYQTVYAAEPGAVAAPTAGLHLSTRLLEELSACGVERAHLTLHVGAGTFQNLRPEQLDRGELHEERYRLPPETAEAIARTRARGGRVVAVGTTATRALESARLHGHLARGGVGRTRLFIREGFEFGVVDAMLTNFHLPRSSLLMLACAFGGRERVLGAYAHAVAGRYRFYSYGDAMLIDPG